MGDNNCKEQAGAEDPYFYFLKVLKVQSGSELWLRRVYVKPALKALRKTKLNGR